MIDAAETADTEFPPAGPGQAFNRIVVFRESAPILSIENLPICSMGGYQLNKISIDSKSWGIQDFPSIKS